MSERAEAAGGVHQLWHQPDMAEDGNAARHQKGDGLRHLLAALQLNAVAAGFLHQPHGVAERLFLGFLIGSEGKIDDDAGMFDATHDGAAVGDHHVQRDADRRVHAVKHHAEGIADQQQIAMRIEQAGNRRRIGGQADDARLAFHLPDGGCCQPLVFSMGAHWAASR